MKKLSMLFLVIVLPFIFNFKDSKNDSTLIKNKELKTNMVDTEKFQGAWMATSQNEHGEEMIHMAILSGKYFATSIYHKNGGKFAYTYGGSWSVNDHHFILNYEFSSNNPSVVGTSMEFTYTMKNNEIFFNEDSNAWKKIDNKLSELKGPWLITGRERDGEMSKWTPGVRKTMKILSGNRFQWIAYNTETGKFHGTGGGTYTADNGEYIENIEFFSRDSSRVGASLNFKYHVENGAWHHSGLSSKGNPIYEIWTPRFVLDKADLK